MTVCAICRRPVWDHAKPVELGDPLSVLNEPVHGGCARRRARLERELEAARRAAGPSTTLSAPTLPR